MSLERIISISNVGRLTALRAAGDVSFSRLTLIYGENGSGKTTLTSVLSSLGSGDPAPILERATLGAADPAEAQVRSQHTTHTFDGSEWSQGLANLEVFDDTFVRENVYAGDAVDVEQRKNLYQVVVGPAAVRLAEQVDELDSEGRRLAGSIRSLEAEIKAAIQSPFELEDFLELQQIDGVEDEIARVTRNLSAARNAQEVMNRPGLARYTLPEPPRDVASVLSESIEGISREAEERVRRHIQSHLDQRGESWIRQGLTYTDSADCPFCAQALSGTDLVEDFRAFFSEAYREHTVVIQRSINEVNSRFNAEALGAVQTTHLRNQAQIESWSELLDISDAEVSLVGLVSAWRTVQNVLLDLLRVKLSNPSSPVEVTAELEAALQDYDAARSVVQEANEAIEEANAKIARFKQATAAADTQAMEQELRRLRNSEIRHSEDMQGKVSNLLERRREKEELDNDKARLREQLRTEAETLLSDYEGEINLLLRRFGASFQIRDTSPSFAGGRASSVYKLAVNGEELPLGNSETPRGTPCFRTALSAGDKSTLALAFFLARLRRRADLDDCCVVLDDPLTSLDAFRTSFTQQEIVALAIEAEQVIVLSHDPFFLKGVADQHYGSHKSLRLARASSTYELRPWDIDHYCLAQAHKDYFILRRFLGEGVPEGTEAITIARSIRPYLEGYLRNLYPGRFREGENLGSLISQIRDSEGDDVLVGMKEQLEELEALNAFSRRFHHSGGVGAPSPITESELGPWVGRAIEFVQNR